MSKKDSSTIFVITAPSGTGKTTLTRRLETQCEDIEIVKSHTTRVPRVNEKNGVDYWFVDLKTFDDLKNQNAFIETAEVHGNYYGTSKFELAKITSEGRKAILEIDVKGWKSIEHIMSEAVSVFLFPPSIAELWTRLTSRATEDRKTQLRRLSRARSEIEQSGSFDFFVINDNLENTYKELHSLIIEGKDPPLKKDEAQRHAEALLKELDEKFSHNKF